MNNTALAQAYMLLRRSNNDLRVVAGKDPNPSGFTLLSLLRNELYFLPAFLSHYRRLGVQRFIFLNDRSEDGSTEYLIDQPDTIIVESDNSYGDAVSIPASVSSTIKELRMMILWRSMMHDMFADERWALQVDLDEFIHLPEGVSFQDLIIRLEQENARAAWGLMLDAYPSDIGALREMERTKYLDVSATWYFDGEQHIRLRRRGSPKIVYPGARARLYQAYGVTRLYRKFGVKQPAFSKRMLRRLKIVNAPMVYNALWKPILVKWSTKNNSYFRSSHNTNIIPSNSFMFPVQHFRFSGPLYRKISAGIQENSYYNMSADHRLLENLLSVMGKEEGSFLYQRSRRFESFDDFVATCNSLNL